MCDSQLQKVMSCESLEKVYSVESLPESFDIVPELKVFDIATDDFAGEFKLRFEVNIEGDQNAPSIVPY